MATLSSSTGSLHSDVRSNALSYKRDKEHSTKWALGTRPSSGVRLRGWYSEAESWSGSPEQQAKVRPQKKYYGAGHKNTGNSLKQHNFTNTHADGPVTRLNRKQDNILEARAAGRTISSSIADLIPTSPPASRRPAPDADILYSFDAPSAPRNSVGLDNLVEKAEKDFMSREIDKIVRNEYEILDESGEVKVLTKGKGKKGSPRQRAKMVATKEDEDDWEQL